jgi:hypothetical protein
VSAPPTVLIRSPSTTIRNPNPRLNGYAGDQPRVSLPIAAKAVDCWRSRRCRALRWRSEPHAHTGCLPTPSRQALESSQNCDSDADLSFKASPVRSKQSQSDELGQRNRPLFGTTKIPNLRQQASADRPRTHHRRQSLRPFSAARSTALSTSSSVIGSTSPNQGLLHGALRGCV